MSEEQEDITTETASVWALAADRCREIWRLCSHYTVVQAALLPAGYDPAWEPRVEQRKPENRPPGYEAAKHAIEQALMRDPDMGQIVSLGFYAGVTDHIDVENSIVWASDLKSWLSKRGIKAGFFFDTENETNNGSHQDYLDPNHPRYAPKLAAAIRAWLAVGKSDRNNGRSAKSALTKWLTENAAELELVDSNGKPNASGIEEIAKVANWQLTGGAPKTSGIS